MYTQDLCDIQPPPAWAELPLEKYTRSPKNFGTLLNYLILQTTDFLR